MKYLNKMHNKKLRPKITSGLSRPMSSPRDHCPTRRE